VPVLQPLLICGAGGDVHPATTGPGQRSEPPPAMTTRDQAQTGHAVISVIVARLTEASRARKPAPLPSRSHGDDRNVIFVSSGEDTDKFRWNLIHTADLVSTIQPAGCYVMPRTYELEPIRHVGVTRICPACGNTRMRIVTAKPSDQFGLDEFAYRCVCGEETVCVMTRPG